MAEWKKLGEVCSFNRGRTITSKNAIDGGIPVIAGGQTPSYYHNEANRIGESITIAGSGAYAGFVAYWNQPIFVSDAFTVDPTDSLLHKYLFYWLKKHQEKVFATQKGAGVPHVHGKDIASFCIPIPSLSEQQRIVGILDIFTSSIDNLKQQIEQRRKQYVYYRERLLDLEGEERVEIKTLGDVCEIKGRIGFRGYTRKDQVSKGKGAISLSPGNITNGIINYDSCTYITWSKYEESPEIMIFEGDIILCKTASVGKVAIIKNLPQKATINPQLVVLKEIKANNKYLYHQLSTHKYQFLFTSLAGIGSVPNISQAKLSGIEIPFPTLSMQCHVVSILDNFEANIANLEDQLKLREKQYEYYRNRLLTFE